MPGDKGFRYAYTSGQITKLLEKVQNTGRPEKLNFTYVRDTWLLKNEQYRSVIDLLEDMEFIDSAGAPTSLYAEYQNPNIAKQTLAKGIKNAYPQLFKAYPNAQSLSRSELDGYFKQQTGRAVAALGMTTMTFKTLCSLADFSKVESIPVKKLPEHIYTEQKPGFRLEPNIYVNIEIHISPEMTDEKIETIFKNMKRYLLTNE